MVHVRLLMWLVLIEHCVGKTAQHPCWASQSGQPSLSVNPKRSGQGLVLHPKGPVSHFMPSCRQGCRYPWLHQYVTQAADPVLPLLGRVKKLGMKRHFAGLQDLITGVVAKAWLHVW